MNKAYKKANGAKREELQVRVLLFFADRKQFS